MKAMFIPRKYNFKQFKSLIKVSNNAECSITFIIRSLKFGSNAIA